MRKSVFVFVLLAASVSGYAQEGAKPWTDWSKKDAEKVLNDSSWGQTYVQEAAEPVSTTVITNTRPGLAGGSNGESGEVKASRALKYRARFLTAKPVREAFSRLIVLSQPNANDGLKGQLQGFIDRDFGDFLVISFSIESEDPRISKGAMMGLGRLTAEMIKDKISLERKDGKKATLIDYKVPVEDGMGAKIVFSRTLDGKPFLGEGDDFVRLTFQLSEKQKISMKFKVTGMTYGGKLEY